jgi:Fe-S-cluster containining protein
MINSPNGKAELRLLEGDKKRLPSLTETSALVLAKWDLQLESYFGEPQDIEWCLDEKDRLQKTKKMIARLNQKSDGIETGKTALVEAYAGEKILCALNNKHRCSLYNFRPIICRLHDLPAGVIDQGLIGPTLQDLSRNVFFSFSGKFPEDKHLSFSLPNVVSGRFVQEYFYYLADIQNK